MNPEKMASKERQCFEMDKNDSYVSPNEHDIPDQCAYETVACNGIVNVAANTGTNKSNKTSKWCITIIVAALILNFLLIVAIGATLFYFQAKSATKSEISQLQGPSSGGLSYTRWGRYTCPTTNETELLYQGTVVGSHRQEAGSSNFLCLHNDPQFLQITAELQYLRGRLYGTEFDFRTTPPPPAFSDKFRHDLPCSVCYTSGRTAKITIPGRTSCPSSWTREYYGYLMGEAHLSIHRSRVPICVDVNTESLVGSEGHNINSLLYFIETTCIGINCPPYSNGAELTCVVCTK